MTNIYHSGQQAKVGDIIIMAEKKTNYSAKKGAKARVIEMNENYLKLKWLDELSNGQMDGGYSSEYFNLNNQTLRGLIE